MSRRSSKRGSTGRAASHSERDPLESDKPDLGSCSIFGTLDALGDIWSMLVLRELFYGVRRFNVMQRELGISRSVLANRLNRLVALGVARSVPYQEPGDRVRHEYRLTRKGVGLLPVVVALMEWGDEHVNGDRPPVVLRHRETGEPVRLELRAGERPVEPHEIVPELQVPAQPDPARAAVPRSV